jgi:LytS/YehU family sensor histidine kinase
LIRIEEELVIARAYLEIEELRLGSKLRSEIEVDDDVLQAEVPALSIQPLVENAIKHGVALRQSPGFVRIRIKRQDEEIAVEISNSGSFREASGAPGNNGVGLAMYAGGWRSASAMRTISKISSTNDVTSVRFSIPAARQVESVAR